MVRRRRYAVLQADSCRRRRSRSRSKGRECPDSEGPGAGPAARRGCQLGRTGRSAPTGNTVLQAMEIPKNCISPKEMKDEE